jgi:excisionase family DNA binding protein
MEVPPYDKGVREHPARPTRALCLTESWNRYGEGGPAIKWGILVTVKNDQNDDDDDVLTLEQAARYLKCHPVTLKRRAKILHIPHKRLGSLWRFYRPNLEAWLRDDGELAA